MLRWNEQPPQAPPDHAEILREAVDDQGVGSELEHRVGAFAVAETMIDLVGNDPDPTVLTDLVNSAQLRGPNDRPGRIGWARNNHATGCRIERRQRGRGELKTAALVAGYFDGLEIQRPQGIAIRDVTGPRQSDAISGGEAGAQREHQSRGRAASENELFRSDLNTVGVTIGAREAVLQMRSRPITQGAGGEHFVGSRNRGLPRPRRRLPEFHVND